MTAVRFGGASATTGVELVAAAAAALGSSLPLHARVAVVPFRLNARPTPRMRT